MVNFPPLPIGSSAQPLKRHKTRRIVPSTAADKREDQDLDRRLKRDRRGRRGEQQVMDRRSGSNRRRSSINLSV